MRETLQVTRIEQGATAASQETIWETLGRVFLRYCKSPALHSDEFAGTLLPVLRRGVRCVRARMSLPAHDDEDWVQDLVRKLIVKQSLLRLKHQPSTLPAAAAVLHTLVHRDIAQCAAQARRRAKPSISLEAALSDSNSLQSMTRDAATIHGFVPLESLAPSRQELWAEIAGLIAGLALTPEEQGPFQLCILEGRGQVEAGAMLSRSQGQISKTIRAVQDRARRLAGLPVRAPGAGGSTLNAK